MKVTRQVDSEDSNSKVNISTNALPGADAVTRIQWNFVTDGILLASLWCLAAAVVNPIGDFPLMDDWSYGWTVKHLLETGDYRPLKWAFMTLVSNVLWGAMFSLPAGFSFTALRIATLVASFLGVIGCYVLVRDQQLPRWLALLMALLLAFNPIYYVLSYSFMTDAFFMMAMTWAAVFLARNLRSGSNFHLLMGIALALVATLSRQLALCVPLGFAIALLLRSGASRHTMLRAATPLLVCLGAFIAFISWLSASGRTPPPNTLLVKMFADIGQSVRFLIDHVYMALVNLGVFLLPILLLSMWQLWLSHRTRAITMLVVGVAIVMLCIPVRVHYGDEIILPMFNHTLVQSGVGPITLRDVWTLRINNLPALPEGFWIVVTGMGLVGAMLLVGVLGVHAWTVTQKLLSRESLDDQEAIGMFLILCGSLYVFPFLPSDSFYDRYAVPLLPTIGTGIVVLSIRSRDLAFSSGRSWKLLRLGSFALLAAFILFAICGTRDYLTWNRVRWTALQELMHSANVDARDIDGGFEFNAWYLYDSQIFRRPDFKWHAGLGWYWVYRDTYQIGFGPVPGYRIIKQYSYQRWLLPQVQNVVVLRKEGAGT